MAKLPSYMKLIDMHRDDNGNLVAKIKIHWWHPGWWCIAIRTVWTWLRNEKTAQDKKGGCR